MIGGRTKERKPFLGGHCVCWLSVPQRQDSKDSTAQTSSKKIDLAAALSIAVVHARSPMDFTN